MNIAGRLPQASSWASFTVNGVSVKVDADGNFSHAIRLTTGANTVTITATDVSGQTSTVIRTITLDPTAPHLIIATPVDNSSANSFLVGIGGAINESLAVTINGITQHSVVLSPGLNTLQITATDQTGKTNSLKRTIFYDNNKPTLAVINPLQDGLTNRDNYILKGVIANLTSDVGISLEMDGQTYTPMLQIIGNKGYFQQPLNFSEEKTYEITVTAVSNDATKVSVKRNVIYVKAVPGDMDGNGSVDAADAILTLQIIAGLRLPTSELIFQGDVAPIFDDQALPDGILDLADVLVLLRTLTRFITTTPVATIGSPSATITNAGPVFYTVTYAGADTITLAAADVTLNKTGTADGTVAVSGTENDRTVTISEITGDGALGISIGSGTASDTAGNLAAAAGASAIIRVDNTAPVVSAGGNQTKSASFIQTGTATDANTLTYSWSMQSGPGTVTFGNPTALSTTISASADGTYVIRFTATDAAGNSSSSEFTLVWDTAAPATTASPAGGAYGSAQAVTLSSNETATIYYTVDGSEPTSLSTIYNASIPLAATTTLKYFAKDLAGNSESVQSQTYTIDTSGPTGTIAVTSAATTTNGTSVTLTLSASDTAGVTQMQFSNDGTNWSTSETYATTKDWTLTSGDGLKTIYVKFKNNFGVWSSSYTTTITLDTLAPATTASPAGGAYGSVQAVTLSANETATIYYTTDGATPTVLSSVYSAAIPIAVTKTLKYFARDMAGNSETVQSQTYTIDTSGPSGTISISGGASTTNGTSVTLTLSASDAAGVTQMQFSNDGTTWSNAETYATKKSWALPSGDGLKTIYVRFMDILGNWSSAHTSTIILDTTAPTTTASPVGGTYGSTQTVTLTANETATIYYTTDGSTPTASSSVYSAAIPIAATTTLKYFARDLVGNSEAVKSQTYTIDTSGPSGTIALSGGATMTNGTSVTLTLTASDAAGIAQMQFSNDGTTWSAAETYAATKSWTLPTGDGLRTIYVKFKDSVGNWSSAFTTAITLDTTAPTVSIGSPSSSITGTASVTYTVTYTGADTITLAAADVTLNKTGTADGTVAVSGTGNTRTVTISGITGDGTLGIRIGPGTASDTAGNHAAVMGASATFTVDNTAPSAVSAGSNQTKGVSFTQTATASDVNALTYSWSMQSGPTSGTVTFGTPSALSTTILPSVNGTYVIRFTATDAAGNSSYRDFTLVWDTTAPAISALANQTISALFTQTATATDANTMTYSWTKQSGTGTVTFGSPTALSTTISANAVGTYVIRFTATDAAGNSSYSEFTLVWVLVTTISGSPASLTNSTTATFTFAANVTNVASYACKLEQPAGTVWYDWYSCTSPVEYVELQAGSHIFSVKATDSLGNTETPAKTYAWTIDTTPPISVAYVDFSSPYTEFIVTFGANEAAMIFYTTDGSDPKVSPTALIYTAPIHILNPGPTIDVNYYAVDQAGNAETTVHTQCVGASCGF